MGYTYKKIGYLDKGMNSQNAYSMYLFTFVKMKDIIEAGKYFIWIDECSWHLDLKPRYGYS